MNPRAESATNGPLAKLLGLSYSDTSKKFTMFHGGAKQLQISLSHVTCTYMAADILSRSHVPP